MDTVHFFQESLLAWFFRTCRNLPWRKDYNPYHVWIAEIMLQQTQLDRCIDYFQRWMQRFPDIASVAEADVDTVLKMWEGLGYYRRAWMIHKTAQILMAQYGGIFPNTYAKILQLPGVGNYTAGAICSIAFRQDIACIDANVERVCARFFHIAVPLRQEPGKSRLRNLVQNLLPAGKAREFNQALMEFGELVCRKNPDCSACPLQQFCEAHKLGMAENLPVAVRKPAISWLEMANGVLLHDNCVFLQRRKPDDVWGGLWEFPGGCLEKNERPEHAVVREFFEETGFAVRIAYALDQIKHSYTRYRIKMYAFVLDFAQNVQHFPEPMLTAATEWKWQQLAKLDRLPMPAPHRKLADLLQKRGSYEKKSLLD